jgi:hypothetical protein
LFDAAEFGPGRFSGCVTGLVGVSAFAAGLFASGLNSVVGRVEGTFASGVGLAGSVFIPAAGCITGAGLIPLSAGIGLLATIVAGFPLLTEANCARLLADALASCSCELIGGAWGARKAATSAVVGRACTPRGPPL